MGEGATLKLGTEIVEWHNTILGGHSTLYSLSGCICLLARHMATERSGLNGSRAEASVNKRERSERELFSVSEANSSILFLCEAWPKASLSNASEASI